MKQTQRERRVILRHLRHNGGRAWLADRDTAEALQRRGLVIVGETHPELGTDVQLTGHGWTA
jgi:hypothetical protein